MTELNTAIVSALTSLSPWASESIVRLLSGDNRLMMPITMVLNAIFKTIELSNDAIMQLFIATFLVIGLYYLNGSYNFGAKLFGGFLPHSSRPMLSFVTPKQGNYWCPTHIDSFFYNFPQYLNQKTFQTAGWIGTLGRCVKGSNNLLSPGTYRATFGKTLDISLTVSLKLTEKESTRTIDITFNKGDETLFLDFINTKQLEIHEPEEGVDVTERSIRYISYFPCRLPCPIRKNDMTVFKNYSHPQLTNLIEQLDALDAPCHTYGYQPRQLSAILYGPAGTGKSTLIRLFAQYKHLDIVSVQLSELKTVKDLEATFWQGLYRNTIYDIQYTLFELDELDKSISCMASIFRQDKIRAEKSMRLVHQMETPTNKQEGDANATPAVAKEPTTQAPFNPEYSWTFSDLLRILCGAHIPHGRKIIATANDMDIITKYCPYLVRPGRMTPVEFTHGTPELVCDMTRHATGDTIEPSAIPPNYRFVQAGLTEFLNTGHRSGREVLDNLYRFQVETTETDTISLLPADIHRSKQLVPDDCLENASPGNISANIDSSSEWSKVCNSPVGVN